MAELFVGPIMDNIINTCLDYLKDQHFGQTSMKEALERLQKRIPIIRSVASAHNQAQIRSEDPALDRWIWQLRDAIDEADDLLDEFEYMKHKEEISKNTEETKNFLSKNARKIVKVGKRALKIDTNLKRLEEVDDLLDEFQYMKHKEQLTENTEETKNKNVFSNTNFLFERAHKFLKVGEHALKIDPNLKRLEEVVQNLDKVSAEVTTFLYILESTKQKQQEQQLELYKTRETGSLTGNDLIGRGKGKEFIIQWLRKETLITSTLYKNISLLSIMGHGGMGKTTLLQHVYEDEITKEFDLKMWVYVSDNFDVKKVISDMLESLTKIRPHFESLHALQESLKSEVMSKKFLLVLDDIWEEEEERDKIKWESVLAPLAYGSLGSKILVTTRMDSVASMIAKVIKNKKETFSLEGLEEDECLQLLNNHAFADVENPDDHKKLKFISGEIVKKLSGSPLAAKVIGGVLRSNFDEEHWRKVLISDFGSADFIQNDIFSIIRLSYTFLPIPLQTCFAFCSVFPQNYEFDKEDLVRMWIALGFIQPPSTSRENLEDIGGKYFDTLLKKSLFDKFEDEDRTWYKMHDLLHELAQSISAQEYFRVVDNEELLFKIPDTIRHLSVEINNLNVLRKLRKFKNLRSLYLTYNKVNQDFVDVLAEIFKASRSLRLLYINALSLKMIPEEIENLIHLRYFKLDQTSVTLLPRSLSNLYHLRFLIYDENVKSLSHHFLPSNMKNLSNLRYLKLPWDGFPGIHEIGKLNSLQELTGFYVKNEAGYKIGELEHLNELHQLRIYNLENVKDAEEACSVKLNYKRNLRDLSLLWSDINSRNLNDLDEKVLDNLQPHNNLKKLRINAYMGTRSAIWMQEAYLISNLEYIWLDNCLEWLTLPPFGQLPFLKSLYLSNMPKVKRLNDKFHGNDMYCVFPSLEVLHIRNFEALEVWFDATAVREECMFPYLTELCLKDCPNLQELTSLPPKLQELKIDNIGWKTFNWLQGTSICCKIEILNSSNLISLKGRQYVEANENCQLRLYELLVKDPFILLMEPLRSITFIQKLNIEDNDELVSFPINVEMWFLQVSSSLCELNFKYLKSLQSLPSYLTSLSSLQILRMEQVPRLQLLQNIPDHLERLELIHLRSLHFLPSSLSISSLKYLLLIDIPLKILPDLPLSLCVLKLGHLENLNCLPSCLPNLNSLQLLIIRKVPQLQELPYLPPSLCELDLQDLENLDCLPSCLTGLYSLKKLFISMVPQLRELPDLPRSLETLSIYNCHSELMELYPRFAGSNWHMIGAMEEWFVGPIMEKLINTCFEYFQDQVKSQTGMKEALERLQKQHPLIQSAVFASNQAHIRDQNPALNKWLWQLRDAIDKADDALDEFEYMRHKEQLTRDMEETKVRSTTSFPYEAAHKLHKVGELDLKIDSKLKRIEEVMQNVDKISADVDKFLDLLESTKEQQVQQLELYKTHEAGSLPKNNLVGRGKEKEYVMLWLRKPSNEQQTYTTVTTLYPNISLLSITGDGGMGKTTLLQHVYNDEITKDFDLKIWVCVSNNFYAERIIAGMLESLRKKRPHLEPLHALQESLKSEVKSKKFLLVLDDIWEAEKAEKDKIEWENVLAPLACGSLGSKILITTQMVSVTLMIAKMIKIENKTMRLDGLEENECLQLLNRHAFADVENPDDHKKLKFITGEIVKKLSRSPLAAKVIGGVLNSSLNERHWIKVLDIDVGSVELNQNAILPILRLSYMFLPKSLQNCFAFCCMFPQYHWFDKDDLVRMWIALDFIQPPHLQGHTVEDIGGRYFNILVKKSFFTVHIEFTTFYKVHGLLHELVQSVSAQECFRVINDEEIFFRTPESIRHLFVETNNLKVIFRIRRFKNLRSLYLTYNGVIQDLSYLLAEIFKASRSIRLLYINSMSLKMIPEVIGYLIHLRYLKLDQTSVTMLPRSLSKLYQLQFIIYEKNVQYLPNGFLPRDMNNLFNLHYLKLPWDDFPGMHEIGKLICLQELTGFYVKNEAGYKIGELEHMNELRQLKIYNLENVKDAEEACNAKLCYKRNLTDLSLLWSDINSRKLNDLDEKVLDNLEPHNNLKRLRINAYMGTRSAIWMTKVHLISNLEYIWLENCLEWITLPPLGQLPLLKSLYLFNMPKVKWFDDTFYGNDKNCVFPSLEVLHISKFEALEDWFDTIVAVAVADECMFPCLIELYLKDCPNLQKLSFLPPKLQELEIDNIGWKALNGLQNISRLAALRNLKIQNCLKLTIKDLSVLLMLPLRSIISFQELTIEDNDDLISFPIEAEQWFLQVCSSLCELNFKWLKSLQFLPSSLTSLSSLQILRVEQVPRLQLLQNIPASLERLELSHLKSLQILPSSLSIPSLKYLFLTDIPLQKLPDLPPSLCVLKLDHLEHLDCLPSCLTGLSSLQLLFIRNVPQLQELPDLPSSLFELDLEDLQNLDCLPYCLTELYSLQELFIDNIPQLRELPDLPPSLEKLSIYNCHPELMERLRR